MTNPLLIPEPFAKDGNKNQIPRLPISGNPRAASWKVGFSLVTMTPKSAGGEAPDGLDVNGVLNAITQDTCHRQSGQRMQFDADYATTIGGYSKGAILQSSDTTKEFISLIDANMQNPNVALGSAWKIYAGDGSVVDASQTVKGVVQFATPTQVSEKQNVSRVIKPSDVVNMFTSTQFSETLPSGRIFQWGIARYTGGLQTFTFDTPFPNGVLHLSISTGKDVNSGVEVMNYTQYNTNGFSAYASALTDYPYFAIGY